MSEIVIRSYLDHSDAGPQLMDIFLESSVKKEFKDEEERAAFYYKYVGFYLEYYPELCLLALKNGKLLGYILGATKSQDSKLYSLQPHLKKFQEFFQDYPAHLHINCSADSRGQGVGSKLIKAFEEKLQKLGVSGLHIMTGGTSRNRSFYQRLGFDFETEIMFQGSPILMMGKKLNL